MTTRATERELKRTSDRLTRGEAEEMLSILAAEFGVPIPRLRWSERGHRGWAYYHTWTISAGSRVWHGTTNCLLHEFAHLLTWHRTGKGGHGKTFIEALRDVATAWHGDPARYGWGLEYKTVAAAGPREHDNGK